MSAAEYQLLFVDNTTGLQQAEVAEFNMLEFTSKFNDVGRFTLDMPYNLAATLVNYNTKLLVFRNAVQIFSGRVTKYQREYSARIDRLAISGTDENIVLQRNLTLPVPLGPPYSSAEFDARSGVASTVMLAYVNNNIGAIARTDRRQVTCGPDYAYGVSISEQSRFETLLDLMKRCALSGGGLGFKVVNGVFYVYLPETKPVLISLEMGNLRSYSYSVEAARANYIYIGGSGSGTSRNFWETNDSSSIGKYGRIERFENRTDVSTADMAATAMSETIYNNGDKSTFSATAIETDATRVWTDYNLGDKVTVEADGMRVTDIVQEIRVKVNAAADEVVETVIGNSDGGNSDPVLAQLNANNNLSARVRRLEAK